MAHRWGLTGVRCTPYYSDYLKAVGKASSFPGSISLRRVLRHPLLRETKGVRYIFPG